jgi:hypothetical protein
VSTNGVTACNCSPSPDINGFDVVVRNSINMNADIKIINSTDSLIVKTGGSLINFSKLINVTNGFLYTETGGLLNIKELIVGSSGKCDFFGNIVTQVKWSVDGTVNLSSQARVIDENLEIKSTGTVNLFQGAELILDNKDLLNDGTLNVNSACVSVENGKIENKGGASVTGNGLLETLSGDIINSGSWSAAVDWCASGSDSGLPTSEDCSVICSSFRLLDVEFSFFDVKVLNNTVVLEWKTSSEINNDYFKIVRSVNGSDFNEVVQISGAGNSQEELYYSFTDEKPFYGISYYRIIQTAYDGHETFSELKAVTIENNFNVSVFPNPASEGYVNVNVRDVEDDALIINIHNLMSKQVYSQIVSPESGNLNINVCLEHLPAGVYLMTGKSVCNRENVIFKRKLLTK